ncbi:MAG: putative DNA binding domain-containing protein [Propionibacteriaceae bacterium]|nr:putative DNA binding domain-containing protein [Propionibacteriaceae bacterium]
MSDPTRRLVTISQPTSQKALHETLEKLIRAWENEVVEFKGVGDSYSTDKIGRYFSALANEANLTGVSGGWLVFGVHNTTRQVIGTDYREDPERLQGLKHQIAQGTSPSMSFRDIRVLNSGGKRVLLMDIPPAPQGIPVAWQGHFYARDGESLTSLSIAEQDAIRQQSLRRDWTAATVPEATLDDFDPEAIDTARQAFIQRHPGRVGDSDVLNWPLDVFAERAKLTLKGKVTRAGLLLVGKPQTSGLLTPHMAQITWALRGEERAYEHFGPPFLLGATAAYERIRNIEIQMLRPNSLNPVRIPKYDRRMVLEAIHNAIAHQDYTLNSRIVVTEFIDRVVIESRGSFVEGSPEDYAEGAMIPTDYRNPQLAQAMSELGMLDTMGFGIHDMISRQIGRYLPLPQYDLSSPDKVAVTIYGGMIDPAFSTMLMAEPNLPVREVIALDRVQKKLPVDRDLLHRMRQRGLVKGRAPNVYVVPIVADSAEMRPRIADAGVDDQALEIVVLKALDGHEGATRKQIDAALDGFLDQNLTTQQRSKKVSNLLAKLQSRGRIENRGSRTRPSWRLVK